MIAPGGFWWQRHGGSRGINRRHVFWCLRRLKQTLPIIFRNKTKLWKRQLTSATSVLMLSSITWGRSHVRARDTTHIKYNGAPCRWWFVLRFQVQIHQQWKHHQQPWLQLYRLHLKSFPPQSPQCLRPQTKSFERDKKQLTTQCCN